MKKLVFIVLCTLCVSCTSNTIFKKPKDLIPRDTMSLLIQELMIASSSKFMTNKNMEKKIDYMPLVYDQFKIDSTRYQTSNLYYMSKIDLYQKIFEDAQSGLEVRKQYYEKIKREQDSLRKDSTETIQKSDEKSLELEELQIRESQGLMNQ